MPMLHVYILHAATKNKFYIGCTSDDLQERIRKHNSNNKGFTRNVNDWVLSYSEAFELNADATRFKLIWSYVRFLQITLTKTQLINKDFI